MNRIDEIKTLFPRVILPTGQPFYIVGFEGEYEKTYLVNIDHKQQLFLGQLITEKTGFNYTLMSLQQAYEIAYSETPDGPNFYPRYPHQWFRTIEAFRKTEDVLNIFPRPKVVEKNSELFYDGESKKIDFCKDDLIKTLTKADLFNKGKNRICGYVSLGNNEEFSLRTGWDTGLDCFGVDTVKSSHRSPVGRVAFIMDQDSSKINFALA